MDYNLKKDSYLLNVDFLMFSQIGHIYNFTCADITQSHLFSIIRKLNSP